MSFSRLPAVFTFIGTMLVGLMMITFQGTILSAFLPDIFLPNLCLCLVVYLALFRASVFGAFLSLFLGLQLDLFASRGEIDQFNAAGLLGPYGAAFVLVFAVVSSFSQRLFIESKLTVALVVGIATLFSHMIYLLVISQFIDISSLLISSMYNAPLEGLVTMLVTPITFSFFNRISRFIAIRELRSSLSSTLREV